MTTQLSSNADNAVRMAHTRNSAVLKPPTADSSFANAEVTKYRVEDVFYVNRPRYFANCLCCIPELFRGEHDFLRVYKGPRSAT